MVRDYESGSLVESEQPLLLPQLWSYWKAHSGRKWMSTGAAQLEFPSEERDKLGRWGSDGSDNYVLAMKSIVYRIQEKVVEACLRDAEELDETEIFYECQEFLLANAVHQGEVDVQLANLDVGTLVPVGTARGSEDERGDAEVLFKQGLITQCRDGPEVSLEELRWEHMQGAMDAVADAMQAQSQASSGMDPAVEREALTKEDEQTEEEDPGAFVLATTARGLVTLHKRDGCHRRPLIHLPRVVFMRTV